MIADILSMYRLRFAKTIAYMLQSTEYDVKSYIAWLWRTSNFTSVMHRRSLDITRRSKLVSLSVGLGIVIQVAAGIIVGAWSVYTDQPYVYFGFALVVSAPLVWAHLICIPVFVARLVIVRPQEQQAIRRSKQIFSDFTGPKIAVAGSYGKTTVKELLTTVLSEGMSVAATPANKNVLVSHAKFAESLQGNEAALIIEYGEGKPGDVAMFAEYTQPTHAVITGIAPAHLDAYKTVEAIAEDVFSLAKSTKHKNVYVNGESEYAHAYSKPFTQYSYAGVGDWKITDISLTIEGMDFTMQRGRQKLLLNTKLVGRHLLGPLAMVVAIADELGLTAEEIIRGVAKTAPYEHRMQPYRLSGGWVIDDSYNGNIDGIKAGTELLASLTAMRKVYVTPGLVEQGSQSRQIHEKVGKYIAKAKPNQVILMKNSACTDIQAGLNAANYKGEIRVEDDPLTFYTHLTHFIAAGDLVMLQNDWTDNYH
jgi:UDP-N-acetylmuramoyl-tripeptide--D-alanyl-D-alanine ligase